VQIGDYTVRARLGEGASGVVFHAVDANGADAVLKVLRPERDGGVPRARFLREARLARGIESRHVVPILDLGESDGQTYLVMPFYRGGSLAARLRETGRLSLDEAVVLAAQLGRGLDELHAHEILHRDVKPSNVLLDADGTAALSDFGLARTPSSTRLTEDGQIVGTPHYLAPELIEGHDATRASDLYSFGCLLFECLAGEPPFGRRSVVELGFAHLVEVPPDPRELRPDLPEDVGVALLKALEKNPAHRPTTATALARMLHVAHTAACS
jgi:serine/threonine-protein kinase